MVANLFVILAREARKAVVFRRGPSKQVLLIAWNLKTDSFKAGQWFKGRVYERRCDLSPSGELLACFAAKHSRHQAPINCWTAISRPPYLTALALWPARYGTHGGGALFEDERTLLLNHDAGERDLANGFHLSKAMQVLPFGDRSGHGGDEHIYHTRLRRDGWALRQVGQQTEYQSKGFAHWQFIVPRIYEKQMSRRKSTQVLQMQWHGIGGRQDDWYVLDHEVLDDDGRSLLKLPRSSWADWDSNGDLLFAEKGRLFRHRWSNGPNWNRDRATEVADLNGMAFEPREAPKAALKWP